MAKKGRKTKYTEEFVKQIEGLAALGLTDKSVYEAVGIDHTTFYRWIEEKKEFKERIKKARAQGKAYDLKIIRDASKKHWTASAWRLERIYPKEFGKQIVDVTVHKSSQLIDDIKHMTDEELASAYETASDERQKRNSKEKK